MRLVGWGAYRAALERLRDRHPGQVVLRTLARSAEGRPLTLLSVGSGRNHVLLLDVVHPNEPVSLLTSLAEVGRAARRPDLLARRDLTLDVLCADPDGLVANDGWIRRGRPDPVDCALHHVRDDDPGEQVEWSFPAALTGWDRPTPGTRVVLDHAESLPVGHRLLALRSGHNISLWTGVYFWLSGPGTEAAVGRLPAAARRCGIPLETGPPESSSCRRRGPGVYEYWTLRDKWDRYGGRGVAGGASAYEHLSGRWPNLVAVNCDVPLFVPTRTAAVDSAVVLGRLAGLLAEAGAVVRDLPRDDPLVRAAQNATDGTVRWGADPEPGDPVVTAYHRAQRAGLVRAAFVRHATDRDLSGRLESEVRRVVEAAVRLGGIRSVSPSRAAALQALATRLAIRSALAASP